MGLAKGVVLLSVVGPTIKECSAATSFMVSVNKVGGGLNQLPWCPDKSD